MCLFVFCIFINMFLSVFWIHLFGVGFSDNPKGPQFWKIIVPSQMRSGFCCFNKLDLTFVAAVFLFFSFANSISMANVKNVRVSPTTQLSLLEISTRPWLYSLCQKYGMSFFKCSIQIRFFLLCLTWFLRLICVIFNLNKNQMIFSINHCGDVLFHCQFQFHDIFFLIFSLFFFFFCLFN